MLTDTSVNFTKKTKEENFMNELITVNYDSEQPTVLGRDLHEALGIDSNYTTWFKRMCEYGFEEDNDYITLWSDSKNGNAVAFNGSPQKMSALGYTLDHQITIPMAKELCMIQRTEVGRKYRQYFLAVEAKWNDPDAVIARGYELSQKKLAETMQLLTEKEAEISEMKPKVRYCDIILSCKELLSVTQIAKDYGKSAIWLNEFLCKHKIQYKQGKNWFLYQRYADKGYAQSKTQMFPGSDGEMHAKVHTYWTQDGRMFIYDLLKSEGILPIVERDED